jgi:hypothetical protein
MENLKSLFEAMKEFIWDIIGYFIPGFYLIILLSVTIQSKYYLESTLVDKKGDGINFIIIILSYVLGYLIYGLGELKEDMRGKKSFEDKAQDEIKNSKNYKLATELLQKKVDASNVTTRIDQLSMKETRNLAMSYAPESDKKVYTFMFRSDLSRHIGNTSFLFGGLALLISILKLFIKSLDLIFTDSAHITMYVLLIISYFIFKKTRDRFYKIAMSIPFSLFISKNNP